MLWVLWTIASKGLNSQSELSHILAVTARCQLLCPHHHYDIFVLMETIPLTGMYYYVIGWEGVNFLSNYLINYVKHNVAQHVIHLKIDAIKKTLDDRVPLIVTLLCMANRCRKRLPMTSIPCVRRVQCHE